MPEPYIGEIRMFGGNFAPAGWALCDGQPMAISENDALFTLIGTTYGGDGQTTFNLPNLQSRFPVHMGTLAGNTFTLAEQAGVEEVTLTTQQIPIHTHPASCDDPATPNAGNSPTPGSHIWASQSATGIYEPVFDAQNPQVTMNANAALPAGVSQPHENMTPFLVVNFIISLFGIFPTQGGGGPGDEPFLGELKIFSFNFAPGGWAMCNGQFLPINQNQALFSLLGTMYGGNGQTTFALPNLQGRTPIHVGGQFTQGQSAGEIAHTLNLSEMPQHTHPPQGNDGTANTSDPTNNFWSNGGDNVYSSNAPNNTMKVGLISNVGGSQAHNNMSPYLVLNFCVALQGIFPSRN